MTAKSKQKPPKLAVTPAQVSGSPAKSAKWFSLAVFLFPMLLFFSAVFNDYTLDDYLVTQNHTLTSQGIAAIPEIFSSPYYQDEMGYSYEYRPMVLMSFAVEHSLFGEHAGISHGLNVLMFALCCWLIFSCIKSLFPKLSVWFPFVISFLFAAHPIHTEVVFSIKNRDEILALLFSLLTLHAALRFTEGKKIFIFLIPVFFTAALMSKVSVLSLVLIIPVLLLLTRPLSFTHYLGLTSFLLLPAHFFITNTGSLFLHLLISGLLFLTTIAFYILRNAKNVWTSTIQLMRKAGGEMKTNLVAPLSNIHLSLPSSADWRQDVSSFTLPGLFLFVFSALLGLYGLLSGNTFALYLALLITGSGYLFFRTTYTTWLPALLTLWIVGAGLWGNYPLSFSFYLLLFFTALGIAVRQPGWTLLIGVYLLQAVAECTLNSTFSALFFFILGWIVSRDLGRKIAGWIWPFVLAAVLYVGFTNMENDLLIGPDVLFALFLAALCYPKYIRRIGKLLFLLIILVGLLEQKQWDEKIARQTKHSSVTHKPTAVQKPTPYRDLIPTGTDRPLGFTEQVIQPNDIWQVKTGTSAAILLKYLQKVIIPYPLACYYGFSEIEPTHITEPKAVAGFLLYLLLALLTLYGWFRDKILAAGLLIYMLSIALFSNLFAPVPGMFAERFLLIPSLGFCIVLVWLLGKVFRADFTNISSWKDIPRGFQFSFVLILSLYSITTVARSLDWKDQLTLFSRDIQHVPRSANLHNLLGLELMKTATENPSPVAAANQQQQAKFHFQQAISIYPDYFNALYDLGRIYRLEQKPDSALLFFERAAALPNQFPPLYLNLAEVAQQTGDTTKLLPCFEKLHELEPANPQYLQYAYQILIGRKDFAAALQKARTAQQLTPDAPPVWMALGFAFKNLNQPDSALFYYQKHYAATGDGKSAAIINELQNTP